MEGLNTFDIIAIVIIVLSVVLSFSRGFIREAMSIIGWIVAAIAAYIFAPLCTPLLSKIAYVGPLLAGSCELSIVVSFAICFAIALLIWSLLTSLASSMAQMPVLNAFDRSLGVLFGSVRGIILIAIVLIINNTIMPSGKIYDSVSNSQSSSILINFSESFMERLPDGPPDWLVNSYSNLMSVCDENIQTTSVDDLATTNNVDAEIPEDSPDSTEDVETTE